MRRVVDTSAWVEFFLGSPLGRQLAAEIPERSQCLVPTIVQMQLAKWMTREISREAALSTIAETHECVVIMLDTSIALSAAAIAREHKLSAADAIIYAAAQNCEADLLTCDAHFKDLPGVIYIPKSA